MTDNAALHAADAAARRRALEVGQSFIVQAPAGSGKTELLAQRVLALLAIVPQPESILAITFTRKAAAEMRERIVGALREAADPAPAVHRLREETRTLALAALAADRRLGWGLLDNPGRLRIQTIDALNHMLARRLPLLSGLGAEVPVEDRAGQAYRLAAERLLLHLAEGEPAHAAAVRHVLTHLDNQVQNFVTLIGDMLARREAWLPLLPAPHADAAAQLELRARLDVVRALPARSTLGALQQALPPGWIERLLPAAALAAEALQRDGRDSPIHACATGGVPGLKATDLPVWQGLAELVLTKRGTPRTRFDATVGLGPNAAGPEPTAAVKSAGAALSERPDAQALLHATRGLPDPRYSDAEWDVLLALGSVLWLAAAELDLVFAERGRIDHPRAALAARAALGDEAEPSDTALALDAQLQHVLVDEFQDTSESQVQLLQRLTAGWQPGDGRTLFLVGDPMQSIYRFRHAEVGLFLAVRDQGIGMLRPEALTLAVNFRSTRPIIDWVNLSFEALLGRRDDELRGQVAYSTSAAAPGAGEEGSVTVHAAVGRDALAEARAIADLVERRLAETAIATNGAGKPPTIAILVRGRNHLTEIVQELRERGIAWRATDIDPLGTRPAVRDLRALSAALEHRADRSAWLATLRAPWCGLTLGDLHTLCGDEPSRTLPELLREEPRRARLDATARQRLERVQPVLEQALLERPRLGLALSVERAWQSLGGPATLAGEDGLGEARAYLDLLLEIETQGGGRVEEAAIDDALHWLYSPASGSPEARVELMTIHRAKGLQFDTVIVPGLERGLRGDSAPLLRWTKLPDPDASALLVAPLKATGAEPGALYQWLGALEKERSAHEQRRLLYVAATRAERELHWFGSLPAGKSEPASRTALKLLWDAVAGSYEELSADTHDEAHGDDDQPGGQPVDLEPWMQRVPAAWSVAAPPAPPPLASAQRPATAAGAGPAFDWASEAARHIGTVVHRELQLLSALAEAGHVLPLAREAESPRFAVELAELGVPEERRAQALERVLAALRRTLADERGRWLLGAHAGGAASELALTGRVGSDVVSVVIDRSFVDSDGVRWIVDYKTSRHEGSGLETFLAAERERYRSQLERYARLFAADEARPIRLGLYFPLLSAWLEWTPGDAL